MKFNDIVMSPEDFSRTYFRKLISKSRKKKFIEHVEEIIDFMFDSFSPVYNFIEDNFIHNILDPDYEDELEELQDSIGSYFESLEIVSLKSLKRNYSNLRNISSFDDISFDDLDEILAEGLDSDEDEGRYDEIMLVTKDKNYVILYNPYLEEGFEW